VYVFPVTTRLRRTASLFTFLFGTVASGCGGTAAPEDAGSDSPQVNTCDSAIDCNDGLFCNGVEMCAPASALADERGCIDAEAPPCAAAVCDEAQDSCGSCEDDADGDSARSIACGGNDCDDDDPNRFPGNLEVCDSVDQDCDPATVGDVDLDNDQAIDDACCNGAVCGTDCDETRPNVNRLAPEVCDGFDNDCNTRIDEGVLVPSWPDADNDGWGDAAATPTMTCTVATGRVTRGGDCNEGNVLIHPEATEFCNSVNDDCDGSIDENGAAVCEATLPGSEALCQNGECVITGCNGTRVDCNGVFTDGCEVDVCTSPAACDGCGLPCQAQATCGGGQCSHNRSFPYSLTVLRDALTGEPIPGATITVLGTCISYGAVTNEQGAFELIYRNGLVRIEAPGYPVHIQPRSPVTGSYGPLISQAALDAWLASEDLTADPTRAIVIANFVDDMQNLDPLIRTTRGGTHHYVDGGVFSPGTQEPDQVLLNVLPGRARVGGSVNVNGCGSSCEVEAELSLEPGTVTYVDGFRCTTVCA